MSRVAAAISITFLAACLCGACSSEDAVSEAGVYAEDGPVRFYDHVAPIFKANCTTCHVSGGIAPFRLDDLGMARTYGKACTVATAERAMPPWAVVADGTCGSFKHSRWLAQADIDTIAAWVDGGMPAGDASADPGVAEPITGLVDGVEYAMPVTYTPQDDEVGGHHDDDMHLDYDDYRCFAIDLNLTKDRFVTAIEVLPGEARVVHHVLAFAVDPGALPMAFAKFSTNQQAIDALVADQGDRPGWPCYGAIGEGVRPGPLLTAWAPGGGVSRYPEGTGLRVGKDDIMVVQMHYNVTGEALPDRSKLRVQWADSVEREAWLVLHDPFLFTSIFANDPTPLPAGQELTTYNWKANRSSLNHTLDTTVGQELELHGIFPHMHKRGIGMDVTIRQGKEPAKCAATLHRWDFQWQMMYWFDEPHALGPDTLLDTTCKFNTSGDTEPVQPGLGSADEMCLLGLFLVEKK